MGSHYATLCALAPFINLTLLAPSLGQINFQITLLTVILSLLLRSFFLFYEAAGFAPTAILQHGWH